MAGYAGRLAWRCKLRTLVSLVVFRTKRTKLPLRGFLQGCARFENDEYLPISLKKTRKVRLKVKWNSNLSKNPFGNRGLSTEVLTFFRSEWNIGNFLTIYTVSQCQPPVNRKQITGNRAANFKQHLFPNRLFC